MASSDLAQREAESAVPDEPTVAQINLTPPRLRAETVYRGHVVDHRLASPARLGVISGPAGSGKSTLLAQCHAADPCSAWLTLTEADNDPVALWSAIIASIRCQIDGFARAYGDRLAVSGESVVDEVATLAANELATRRSRVHLFLDDLQLVDNTECIRSIHRFISMVPEGVRVTIASRKTSPFPLAKFRVEGQLIECNASVLTLSDEEAAEVFGNFGVELDPDVVTVFNQRTEGWAAGITLAAMAVQDTEDTDEFMRAFTGTDSSVTEFLIAEVLAKSTPAERQFLHKTAVLRQMSGELCDELTGRSDGAGVLARLEESNAFVVALDRTGGWYRYHRLFADLLIAELHDDPAKETELHDRAFEWLRDHQMIPEAIHHALLAGRQTDGADLLCATWLDLLSTGRLATVRSLIGELRSSPINEHQPLTLAAAFAFGMSGLLDESRRYLAIAEQATYVGPPPDGTASMESCLALTRGCLALDGIDSALADVKLAYDLEPPESPWRTLASLVVGLAMVMKGDDDESVPFFEEAVRSTEDSVRAYGLAGLAQVSLARDEPGRAALLAGEASAIIEDAGIEDLIQAATAHAVVALSSLELGDEKRARESVRMARRPMEIAGQSMPMDTMNAALLLARAALELGNTKDAERFLGQASQIAAAVTDTGVMSDRLGELAARLASVQVGGDSDETPEFTDRELEVLALLPAQLTTREIAEEMFLSRNTIKTHLRRIYKKLDAGSRDEAIDRARELGAITAAT